MKSDNPTARMRVTILGQASLYEAAAEIFTSTAREAINSRGVFAVALSGGTTPCPLYSLLAQNQTNVDWDRTRVFFSDERCVPPDNEQSNYRMIREALLDKIPLHPQNVHRMKGEMDPQGASLEYSEELREVFGLSGDEPPRLDLLLLGIGEDCHTASLFPGSDVLSVSADLAAAVYVPKLQAYRLTLTPRVITNSSQTIVLATGKDKSRAVKEAVQGSLSVSECPAQLLRQCHGLVTWLLDEEAASELYSVQ